MKTIPINYVVIKSTPFFDNTTVPKTLLSSHCTDEDVYARLSVMQGSVKYIGLGNSKDAEPEMELIVKAGEFGISVPKYWHKIELLSEDTYFNLDFFGVDTKN